MQLRPEAAIGSRFSANGYTIDQGLAFCDPIRDCNPVILPELSSTEVGFWSILDAVMKCVQIAKRCRSRHLERDRNCMSAKTPAIGAI